MITKIGTVSAIESIVFDGVRPLRAELDYQLGGAPTAVVLGELSSLLIGDDTALRMGSVDRFDRDLVEPIGGRRGRTPPV